MIIKLIKLYFTEAQEDVLAQFDARSVSYIGNRLLYACQDKKWWLEGHNIVKIMIRCNVPFYRYSEIGKQMSCITAINICLHANDVPTAYNIHLSKYSNIYRIGRVFFIPNLDEVLFQVWPEYYLIFMLCSLKMWKQKWIACQQKLELM